ncbi:MAG: hypothetical protein OEM03_12355, partial [Chromatiales bacterium]|nr:hypothetical protein [Chromatiales bacterium]
MEKLRHTGLGAQLVSTAFPRSPFVVMKFGGSSVSSAESWKTIAELVRQRIAEGLKPVLVHSALAGVSNVLQALPQLALQTGADEQVATIRRQHHKLAHELGVDPMLCEPHFDELQELVSQISR